jgi:HAD superfamily phosphatase
VSETRPILVFDMDGVLVEVTESYHETIAQTVKHFTGKTASLDAIQAYKNQIGNNNDWGMTQRLCADLGVEVEYDTVVGKFQELFLGPNHDGVGGMMEWEKWAPNNGLLERLAKRYQLAIFTGRPRMEMDITLNKFGPGGSFGPTICDEDTENGKPAPDGLHKIAALHPGVKLWYVGDTVDDSASAKAAGVPFIGIAGANISLRDELVELFKADGAIAVIEDINGLEEVLP